MKKIREMFRKSGGKDALSGEGQSTAGKNPGRKKLLVGIASFVIVLIILALIAPFVIDLNKYKGTILSKLRPAIHRNVDFESINLTVLTGIGAEIQGLKIPENPAFANDNFVSLESAKVRLQFLPLLKGEIRIAKIVLKSPAIRVRRNVQGVFNFSDIVGPEKKKEEKKESKLPAIIASIGISELSIKDATLVFEDKKDPNLGKDPHLAKPLPPAQKNITVSRLNIDIEDISLSQAISIAVEGSLLNEPDRNFSLSGEVGPIGMNLKVKNMPLNLVFSLDAIPLKKLTEDLGLSSKAASGTVSGDITATGYLNQKIAADTDLKVNGLVMQRKPGTPAPQKQGSFTGGLAGKIVYDTQPKDVIVEATNLTVNGSRFSVAGTAKHVTIDPEWNFVLRSVSLEPASLMDAASAFGVNLPATLQLKGPAKLQFSTAGTPKDIAVEAGVEMNSTEITYGKAFHKPAGLTCTLGSTINITEEALSIRTLNVVLYNLLLSGTGEMNKKAMPQEFNIKFDTKPFSLKGWDALIPAVSAYKLDGSVAMNAGITGTKPAPVIKFQALSQQIGFTLPANKAKDPKAKDKVTRLNGLAFDFQGKKEGKAFDGLGTFGIQSGNFSQITLGKVASNFRYAGKKFDVPNFSMNVFNGSVSGSAAYLTDKKDWSFNPTIKGIDAGQAMNTLTSFKNIFSGTLSGTMQARGNTTKKGLDSLATKGAFKIAKGTMNNLDITRSVIDGLTGIQGLSGLINTEQSAVQRNRETRFDSFNVDFQLVQKVLQVPSLKLVNISTGKETNSEAAFKGTVDMVTKKVDFDGDVAFSPEYSLRLAKRTPAMNALINDQRRAVLPVKITGTTTKPLLTLHTKEITRAMTDYYAKKGIEKGVERLKKKFNIPEENNGAQEAIDGLFNKFMKKK